MKSPLYIALLLLIPLCDAIGQLPLKTVHPGSDLLFSFSNGYGAFYCGPLAGDNTNDVHGVTGNKRKLFEQYWIQLGDSVLDRRTAECTVSPVGIQRRYPFYNTIEEIFFADSLTMLVVGISTDFQGDVRLYPSLAADFSIRAGGISGGTFVIESDHRLIMNVSGLDGGWGRTRPRDVEQLSSPPPANVPAMYWGRSSGSFGFSFEWQPLETEASVRTAEELHSLLRQKSSRIETMISEAAFSSGDVDTDDAFNWILTSMDALLVRRLETGILAGLPWYDGFRGRDTFMSLPGALLSTGRFEDALRILEAFAARMDTARASQTYGRILDRMPPDDESYNTADGTPWMLLALWRYYEYSGDAEALRRLFPAVQASVDGALARTDAHGLLRHGDADTWMNAVGVKGPWSPRGDRAIEIQALWLAQLRVAASIARIAGKPELAYTWEHVHAARLASALKNLYVDASSGVLRDHINSDNSADARIRPNALVGFSLPFVSASSFPLGVEDSTLLRVFSECVFPWGVASLSTRDDYFHPYHEAAPHYSKDAAYHNGTIWTALSGPAIDMLCRHGLVDTAWTLTQSLHRLCNETGAVGTIPECSDALPHPDNEHPRWSGTYSQAWSNAEYLRVMYEQYLGVRVRQEEQAVIEFAPHLPAALDRLTASVRTSAGRVRVTVDRVGKKMLRCVFESTAASPILLRSRSDSSSGPVPLWLSGPAFRDVVLQPGQRIELELGNARPAGSAFARNFSFARASDPASYAVLRPSAPPLLTSAEVTARNPEAARLCSATDALNDDNGPDGGYTYPANPLFPSGIADIASVDVSADEQRVYFTIGMRALTQPGGHRKHGFQLAMLAIAVDRRTDGTETAALELGRNSGYILPEESGYTHLIFVGGGLEVQDSGGNMLASYTPETAAGAFGNASSGELRFALPLGLFGKADAPWRFVVVAGMRDDNGGAGIGKFRTVLPEQSEWHGGGSANRQINWYDDLHCP